jgi:hypothetical protein
MSANRNRFCGRRGGARGAILVESLIVACLLAIIFVCGIFLSRLFEEKLGARRDTTAQTWFTAEKGCGDPAGGKLDNPGSLETTVPPPINSQYPDATFLGTFLNWWVSISRSVTQPVQMGGAIVSFWTKDQVLCADPKAANAGDPKNPLGAVTWAAAGAKAAAGL